ncbi:ferritin family protein [Phytohabitans suffuscus]|uniref:propane 2-monooxygenase n=1 Tax=Phytohabitans suffuscus TaxID=624315 RepID=A0A6F8YTN3_9ACTN|nr:phenol 2-monooxygenase [Phytohabitans suffuscus]BCB89510.1 phenol hydroxylase P1 protein [Phytohabitans suffuscus]
MQYELRQQVVEPRRKTFKYLADRYGDQPVSRYVEATVGVQPTENFHYRPLWAPDHELYDETYSALRLADPYSFLDPRQYYYAPYVTARAQWHDAVGRTLRYVEDRRLFDHLPAGWRELLGGLVLPLRHYESGAQLVCVTGARFAYGTSIEQCLSYAAFDRIGLAQTLSRVGFALADGGDELLGAAKESWVGEPALQGLRRLCEELLVEPDWGAAAIGLDLADRLLYPLLYQHLDEAALRTGAGPYSLFAQHPAGWYADHRRWLDALVGTWCADPVHGAENRAILAGVVAAWLPRAAAAVTDFARGVERLVAAEAPEAVAALAERAAADLARLGVPVEPQQVTA